MGIRTDLAIELEKQHNFGIEGIKKTEKDNNDVHVTEIEILTETAALKIGKPVGKYITLEFPSIEKINSDEEIREELIKALKTLCPQQTENILIVGLGNDEITADSIGPKTARQILATRHIVGEFAEKIGLRGLKSTSVLVPNVLGKTGLEVSEIIEGIIKNTKPQAAIIIDALSASSVNLVFKTIQLCDTGITPGSGVKNARKALNSQTLGIPVIAVGVPTVVDVLTLAFEITENIPKNDTDMIVTPKDADLLSDRISEILSGGINIFLQPEIEPDIIFSLV